MTFLFTSIYIPYFYLEEFARSQNVRAPLLNYTLSITNAASFLGRIFPNLLANRYVKALISIRRAFKLENYNTEYLIHFFSNRVDSLALTGTYCLISGATVLLWLLARGQTWTMILASVYGFMSGGLVSLPPATLIALAKNPNEHSSRIGLAFTICSFGALIGNPIAGALIGNAKLPFMRPWIFAGGTMILAGVLTVAAYYFHSRATAPIDNNRDLEGRHQNRYRPRRLQSLVNEALMMQSTAAFAM
jgi:hypothetical protein